LLDEASGGMRPDAIFDEAAQQRDGVQILLMSEADMEKATGFDLRHVERRYELVLRNAGSIRERARRAPRVQRARGMGSAHHRQPTD
jgi:hypothetical protein